MLFSSLHLAFTGHSWLPHYHKRTPTIATDTPRMHTKGSTLLLRNRCNCTARRRHCTPSWVMHVLREGRWASGRRLFQVWHEDSNAARRWARRSTIKAARGQSSAHIQSIFVRDCPWNVNFEAVSRIVRCKYSRKWLETSHFNPLSLLSSFTKPHVYTTVQKNNFWDTKRLLA